MLSSGINNTPTKCISLTFLDFDKTENSKLGELNLSQPFKGIGLSGVYKGTKLLQNVLSLTITVLEIISSSFFKFYGYIIQRHEQRKCLPLSMNVA